MAYRWRWPRCSTGRKVLAYVDTRRDYDEVREVGFGLIASRLYCAVFTQRGDAMHIISMRKANKREVMHYAEHD